MLAEFLRDCLCLLNVLLLLLLILLLLLLLLLYCTIGSKDPEG